MKPKLWIFDVDGTLVDSLSASYAIDQTIIEKLGDGNAPDIDTYRQLLGEKNWQEFYANFGVTDYEKALHHYYYMMSKIYTAPIPLKAIPGVKKLLRKLQGQNVPRTIISINGSLDSVINKLDRTNLLKYFDKDSIHVTDDSKKEVIVGECERREIQPAETVYIGDTAKDVREGRAAGVKTIAIANQYSYNPSGVIERAKPDYLVRDISDISQLLENRKSFLERLLGR